ncbi:acid-resistance membrane protein [Legionella rubrilucens]|uniref:Acid-resistance membrane protein n=1 Tax=Legionella rubrilucens TaxID=458 RepID=A0A0W0Y764_9GAMM|nr:DUF308 domain-containing protein [Legionella rubrilucens]KTD52371.1 acid-resistance membrane protein [Legionella rubrilucens]
MTNQDNLSADVRQELHRNWGWLLALGILFVLLGVIGLGMVVGLTLASVLLIGILLIIGGVIQVVDSFKCRGWKAFIWHFLIALFYIFAGGLMIYDPVLASVMITAMIAWLLIIIGIARCIMAFSIRESTGWYWLLLAGIAALILGILILVQWPMSGFWVIGLFIAIEMLINGWSYIFLALAMRRI